MDARSIPVEYPTEEVISTATHREDVLLWRAFRGKRTGFYIDIGAGDPNYGSITQWFYRVGWRGINVEPHPMIFPVLDQWRPGDVNLNLGVSDVPGVIVFYQVVVDALGQGWGLSSFNPESAAEARRGGYDVVETQIKMMRLQDVVDTYCPGKEVDFLKIDVENYEAAVVRSADWARFRPKVICIEATLPMSTSPSFEQWEPLLLDAGYQFALFDGVNNYYLQRDLEEIRSQFNCGVNPSDHWRAATREDFVEPWLAGGSAQDLVISGATATADLQQVIEPGELLDGSAAAADLQHAVSARGAASTSDPRDAFVLEEVCSVAVSASAPRDPVESEEGTEFGLVRSWVEPYPCGGDRFRPPISLGASVAFATLYEILIGDRPNFTALPDQPDDASAPGAWLAAASKELMQTDAFRARVVDDLLRLLLLRPGRNWEIDTIVGIMGRGGVADVIREIARSEEYWRDRGGESPRLYVTACYELILNTDADERYEAFAARNLAEADERDALCRELLADPLHARAYQDWLLLTLLGRAAREDELSRAAELLSAVGADAFHLAAIAEIVSSGEFIGNVMAVRRPATVLRHNLIKTVAESLTPTGLDQSALHERLSDPVLWSNWPLLRGEIHRILAAKPWGAGPSTTPGTLPVAKAIEALHTLFSSRRFRLMLKVLWPLQWQLNPAPGPLVIPVQVQQQPGWRAKGQPTITTTYFYWYDTEHGLDMIANPDNQPGVQVSSSLTHHPVTAEGWSYRNVDWHKRELNDMQAAGIDIVLPLYLGSPYSGPNVVLSDTEKGLGSRDTHSDIGLRAIVAAREALLAEGKMSPAIGMFYDTTSLNYHNAKQWSVNFATAIGLRWFYETIRNFFSHVPAKHWAAIEGRPIVYVYHPCFGRYNWEDNYTIVGDAFEEDFGVRPFIVTAAEQDAPRVVRMDTVAPLVDELRSTSPMDVIAGIFQSDDFFIHSKSNPRLFLSRLYGKVLERHPTDPEVWTDTEEFGRCGRVEFVRRFLARPENAGGVLAFWARRFLRIDEPLHRLALRPSIQRRSAQLAADGQIFDALADLLVEENAYQRFGGRDTYFIDILYRELGLMMSKRHNRAADLAEFAELGLREFAARFARRPDVRSGIASHMLFYYKSQFFPGRADLDFYWAAAIEPVFYLSAALGPGYDQSAIPTRPALLSPRQDGRRYRAVWEQLLSFDPRTWLVHVETWNEFFEGTDICHSREFGRFYIELTREYADVFHSGARLDETRYAFEDFHSLEPVVRG
jgi:FkbM family methyltransferase